MSNNDLDFFGQNESEKATILIISNDLNNLTKSLSGFLVKKEIEPIHFLITDDLKNKYEDLLKRGKKPYKIVFIYGFSKFSKDKYKKVFSFLDFLSKEKNSSTPPSLIFLSKYTTSLNILDNINPEYDLELKSRESFINEINRRFPKSLFFLAQDLMSDDDINYPFKLFLTALKNEYFLNPQASFYWQSENSFLKVVKKELIKPHQANKFLIRGKKTNSIKTVLKIKNLYQQYFQKDFKIISLISEKKIESYLNQFKKATVLDKQVKSSTRSKTSELDKIIDQKVRIIPKIKRELDFIALSNEQINKVIIDLEKKDCSERVRVKSTSPTSNSDSLLIKNKKRQNKGLKSLENNLDKKTDKSVKKHDLSQEDKKGVEIDKQLFKLFSKARKEEKVFRTREKIGKNKAIIKKSNKRKILFYGGGFSFLIAFLIIVSYLSLNLSKKRLSKLIYSQVESHILTKAEKSLSFDLENKFISRFFDWQYRGYSKILNENLLNPLKSVGDLRMLLTDISVQNEIISNDMFTIYSNSLNREGSLETDYASLHKDMTIQLKREKELSLQLKTLNTALFKEGEKAVWDSFKSIIETKVEESLVRQRFLTSFLEYFLSPGKKSILVIIQDDSELRSTGGNLKTVLLMSFEGAYLINKQFLDINELSGGVYGEKMAYDDQKSLFNMTKLSLKESNWQVDFSKSNEDITWFVEQSIGEKIDLSVILNSKTIDKLIKFNLLNNQDDLDRVFNFSNQELDSFLNIVFKDLAQKEIFMQSKDELLQEAISANTWSGELLKSICPLDFQQENCFLDYIFQFENSVGKNNISRNISQEIEHNLGVGKDFVRHKRKITFKNKTRKSELTGKYENYLQFYLPLEARVEKIVLNGNKIGSSFYEERVEAENKLVSILLEIPSESEYKFEMTYLIKNKMISPFSYVFLNQKQAGLSQKKSSYNIVFDEFFKPQLIAPKANYKDQVINFEKENEDHFIFAVSFH